MLNRALTVAVTILVTMNGCSNQLPTSAPRSLESFSPSPFSPSESATPPDPAPPASQTAPSKTATMLCGPEIQKDVMIALGLTKSPPTNTAWIDRLFTCTYSLPVGTLVLSVKEGGSLSAGQTYFDQTKESLKSPKKLTGMQGLGQPGYETVDGVVLLLKDDKTLQVDATNLAAQLGPHKISPAAFAYEIATDILGCWNEK